MPLINSFMPKFFSFRRPFCCIDLFQLHFPFFNDAYPDILFCLDTMISSGCILTFIHTMLCKLEARSVDVGLMVQATGVTQGQICEPWRCQTYSAEF